jgi:pectinesterase
MKIIVVAIILSVAFAFPSKKTKVYMIGDSTMCLYPTKQLPINGWGMPFANYFDSAITIDNRARGGRSTRTFISEGRWQPIADSLEEGDYVLIQFGHNDESSQPQYADRYTPVPDFKTNLVRFITETRSKKAIPVLITPVSRRNFDKQGNAKETHIEYTKAVFEIGGQYKVPVIDLDKMSRDLYQQMGPEKAKWMFMELDSAEHPNYPVGRHDNTHFNEYGARRMAELVLNDLKRQHIALAEHIVIPGPSKMIVVAADGSGNYRTVQAALDAIPMHNKTAVTIFIKNGLYREKLHLDATKDFVTLKGENRFSTILTYDDHPGIVSPKGDSINTRSSHSFIIQADNFSAENICFRNDAGFSAGQAVALEVQGDKETFFDCRIVGNQDILFLNSETSRQYYRNCYIEGTTDFIFGPATAWFEGCQIHSKKNSHVTAASTPQEHPFGFVFDHCQLTGDTSIHNASLGRPWRPYADVNYLYCFIGRHIRPEGWSNWNNTDSYKTARYAEYKNDGPGAAVAGRAPWSQQLTDEQAQKITVKNVFGDWLPDRAAAGPAARPDKN